MKVEITRVSQEPEVYSRGKNYRLAELNIIIGDKRFNNLAVQIEEDEEIPYLDFTKTAFKSFGKYYLNNL